LNEDKNIENKITRITRITRTGGITPLNRKAKNNK